MRMDKNIVLLDIVETDVTKIVSVSLKRINITDRFEVIEDRNFHRKMESGEYLKVTEVAPFLGREKIKYFIHSILP